MTLNGKRMILDGHDFLLCLPDKSLGLLPESTPDNVWTHILAELNLADVGEDPGWFWCQNESEETNQVPNGKYIGRLRSREYSEKHLEQTTEDDYDGIGWRPILIPLTPQAEFDPEVFGHIPNGTRAKMYTVIMGGKTVRVDIDDPELYMIGSSIVLTDQFHSNNTLVGWVICDGIAIADRNLLGDISWSSLRDQGLFEDEVDITIAPLSQLAIYHALIRCKKNDDVRYAQKEKSANVNNNICLTSQSKG